MSYLKVEWMHNDPDEPVLLYSELDDERWEVRKVEVFRNGSMGIAGPEGESGSTWLGERAIPPIAEIAADPAFRPHEINQEEFEKIWAKRDKLVRSA